MLNRATTCLAGLPCLPGRQYIVLTCSQPAIPGLAACPAAPQVLLDPYAKYVKGRSVFGQRDEYEQFKTLVSEPPTRSCEWQWQCCSSGGLCAIQLDTVQCR